MKIMVINGPNLNLLGQREPEVYGTSTYADLKKYVADLGEKNGLEIEMKQSNHEGEIIDWIHEAGETCQGIIINPAAYSHYSIAIYDALQGVSLPKVEVHLSNIYARDDFREKSITGRACQGVISGFGFKGYGLALDALKDLQAT